MGGGSGRGGKELFLTVGLKEQVMEAATKIRREQIKERPLQKMLWSLVEGGSHPVTTQQRESKGNKYLDLSPLQPPSQKPEDKGAINGAHNASRMQSSGELHREWTLSNMLLHHRPGDCSYLHSESQVTATSVSIKREGEERGCQGEIPSVLRPRTRNGSHYFFSLTNGKNQSHGHT